MSNTLPPWSIVIDLTPDNHPGLMSFLGVFVFVLDSIQTQKWTKSIPIEEVSRLSIHERRPNFCIEYDAHSTNLRHSSSHCAWPRGVKIVLMSPPGPYLVLVDTTKSVQLIALDKLTNRAKSIILFVVMPQQHTRIAPNLCLLSILIEWGPYVEPVCLTV